MLRLDAYSAGLLFVLISAPIALIVEDISLIDSIPSILYTISMFIFIGYIFIDLIDRVVAPITLISLLGVFFYALIISFIVEVNIISFIELCYILVFYYTFYVNRDISVNKIVRYAYFVGIVYLLYVLLSTYYIDSSINYLRFTYFLPVVIISGLFILGEVAHYLRKTREKVMVSRVTEKNSLNEKAKNKTLISKPKNKTLVKKKKVNI